ncbi:MAG: hypothetical protein RR843_07175 [Clostridia bacterium]
MVDSWAALERAIAEAKSPATISVGGDFFADSDVILAEKIICLTGSGVITRGAGVGGSLLTITGGSLTLGGNVTLSGANAVGARSALVRVRGGELILLPGATLRGNAGDGVCVEGGRFQMAGGRISENNGSGVSVTAGTFSWLLDDGLGFCPEKGWRPYGQ